MKCYIQNEILQIYFQKQITKKKTFKLKPFFLRYQPATISGIYRQLMQAAIEE